MKLSHTLKGFMKTWCRVYYSTLFFTVYENEVIQLPSVWIDYDCRSEKVDLSFKWQSLAEKEEIDLQSRKFTMNRWFNMIIYGILKYYFGMMIKR